MIAKEKLWLCVFELDGGKHLIKATNDADEATTRKHIQQMNPAMRILELREAKGIAEIEAVADEIRKDEYHVPMTNADLVAKETQVVS